MPAPSFPSGGDARRPRTDLRAQPHGLFRTDRGTARQSRRLDARAHRLHLLDRASGARLDFDDLQSARAYGGSRSTAVQARQHCSPANSPAPRRNGSDGQLPPSRRRRDAIRPIERRLRRPCDPFLRPFFLAPEKGADTIVYLASRRRSPTRPASISSSARSPSRPRPRATPPPQEAVGGERDARRRRNPKGARDRLAAFAFVFAAPWRQANLERGGKLRLAESGQRRAGPAPPAPGVVEGGEGVRRDGAFERLLVRGELEVGVSSSGARVANVTRALNAWRSKADIPRRREARARSGGNRRRWSQAHPEEREIRTPRPLCRRRQRAWVAIGGRAQPESVVARQREKPKWPTLLGQGQDRSARCERQFPRNV